MLAARRASVFASNSHHRLLASSVNRAYSTQNINNEVTKEQSTVSEAKEKVTSKQAKIYQYKKPPPRPESRLTQYLRKSPKAMSLFTSVFDKIVTGNPRQVAGRITLHYYEQVCAPREAEEREFWHKGMYILSCLCCMYALCLTQTSICLLLQNVIYRRPSKPGSQ